MRLAWVDGPVGAMIIEPLSEQYRKMLTDAVAAHEVNSDNMGWHRDAVLARQFLLRMRDA